MFKLNTPLRKASVGALAAATLAGSLLATTASADARPWGHRGGWGPGIAAGVIGGLALGALASRPYYNGYYGGGPYYASGPGYYGRCWYERQEVLNRWGQPVLRNVRVCG